MQHQSYAPITLAHLCQCILAMLGCSHSSTGDTSSSGGLFSASPPSQQTVRPPPELHQQSLILQPHDALLSTGNLIPTTPHANLSKPPHPKLSRPSSPSSITNTVPLLHRGALLLRRRPQSPSPFHFPYVSIEGRERRNMLGGESVPPTGLRAHTLSPTWPTLRVDSPLANRVREGRATLLCSSS